MPINDPVSPREAATLGGVTERTIILWIEQGLIRSEPTPAGTRQRHHVSATEVQRVAIERQQKLSRVTSSELKRIADLEALVAELQRKLESATKPLSTSVVAPYDWSEIDRTISSRNTPSIPKRPSTSSQTHSIDVPPDLPSGSMLVVQFGSRHGVKETSIRRHADHLAARQGTHLWIVTTKIPDRSDGKENTWITPAGMIEMVEYWQSIPREFPLCNVHDCPCHPQSIVSAEELEP
jgi:DNA-binding transcriptional MerR regulator